MSVQEIDNLRERGNQTALLLGRLTGMVKSLHHDLKFTEKNRDQLIADTEKMMDFIQVHVSLIYYK